VDRRPRNSRDLIEELRGLLERAVARAVPEAGVGVSLSGGMDSSSVWATLASLASPADLQSGRFRPYSNVYPGLPCDETPFIRSIHSFLGIDGLLVDTTGVRAGQLLDTLIPRFDLPHFPTALPLELVCKAAAANGHSTLFTGLGGDEWLGGSLDYVRELFYSGRVVTALRDLWRVRLPERRDGFRSRISWLSPGLGLATRFGLGRYTTGGMRAIVGPEHRGGTAPVRGSWQERVEGEAHPLPKKEMVRSLDRLVGSSVMEFVEQQGAQHEVEIRHPLMDVDIVKFGFTVESRALVAGRCHKWLLRRAMADRLPADVTGRIETTGFDCLDTREQEVLNQLPPGSEWHLARLGIVLADSIDSRLTKPYSYSAILEMIQLWWLESFVRRTFSSRRPADPADIG